MTNKLRGTRGLSRVEAFCIVGISAMAVFLVITGFFWYRNRQLMAEDRLMVNTAQSVAGMNATGNACPVRDCDGGGGCTHRRADGTYVGYFNHPDNTIAGDLPGGYNSFKTMKIGGRTYHGRPGTMVIRVELKDGEAVLSWVKGR